MLKKIFSKAEFIFIFFLVVPFLVFAQTASPSMEDLQKQIQQLLGQVQSLQKEVTSLKAELASPPTATDISKSGTSTSSPGASTNNQTATEEEAPFWSHFNRSLSRGVRGDDVKALQTFFAKDPDIYPEGLVTGYFGPGTEAAVQRWQKKHGVSAAGIVGPKTIAKFNELYGAGNGDMIDTNAPQPTVVSSEANRTLQSCPVYTTLPLCTQDQVSRDTIGCYVCRQATMPFPDTNLTDKKNICPSLPVVDSCPTDQEKIITYSSTACGTYYTCAPKKTEFTLQTQTQMQTTTNATPSNNQSCDASLINLLGTGCHSMYMDAAGNAIFCDGPMTKSAKRGDTTAQSGCSLSSGSTNTNPPSGQKEQIWNSLGLRSWIRTDADSARIDQLKQTCSGVAYSANIWMPSAGVSTNVDFGMPNPDKCRLAAACASNQYFDGAACVAGGPPSSYSYAGDANSCPGFSYSRWDNTGRRYCQLNTERKCDFNYPSYLTNGANYKIENCPVDNTTTVQPFGSPIHPTNISAFWNASTSDVTVTWTDTSIDETRFQIERRFFVNTGGTWTSVGTVTSTTGAATGAVLTYHDPNTQTGYTDYKVKACNTHGCSDGFYTTVSIGGSSQSSAGCSSLGSGWTTYGNYCLNAIRTQYIPTSSPFYSSVQSCTGTDAPVTGCSMPSSSTTCSGSQYWNGSSCVTSPSGSTCPTGQYWNGSSCVVNQSSTNTCPSGQYWNGSSCVSSTSGSSCTTGQYWNGYSCVVNQSSSTCSSGQYWNGSSCVANTTTYANCSQYGSGWHTMSSDGNCYDSDMRNYHTFNGTLYSCSTTPASGCSSSTTMSSGSCTGTPSACVTNAQCANAGYYWSNNACYSSSSSTTGASACSSTQYWNGSSCVTSPSGSTCPTGQYWNGSSCVVNQSSTNTCPSGQYWSGSSCVNNPTSAMVLSRVDNVAMSLRSLANSLKSLLNLLRR